MRVRAVSARRPRRERWEGRDDRQVLTQRDRYFRELPRQAGSSVGVRKLVWHSAPAALPSVRTEPSAPAALTSVRTEHAFWYDAVRPVLSYSGASCPVLQRATTDVAVIVLVCDKGLRGKMLVLLRQPCIHQHVGSSRRPPNPRTHLPACASARACALAARVIAV